MRSRTSRLRPSLARALDGAALTPELRAKDPLCIMPIRLQNVAISKSRLFTHCYRVKLCHKLWGMRDEIAKFRGPSKPEQININVDQETKGRYRALREQYGINMGEETRKAILGMLDRLEKIVSRGV